MSPKLDLAGIPERRDTVVLVLLCYKIWIKSSPDQSWQAFQTSYRLRETMSTKLDLAGIPERVVGQIRVMPDYGCKRAGTVRRSSHASGPTSRMTTFCARSAPVSGAVCC